MKHLMHEVCHAVVYHTPVQKLHLVQKLTVCKGLPPEVVLMLIVAVVFSQQLRANK